MQVFDRFVHIIRPYIIPLIRSQFPRQNSKIFRLWLSAQFDGYVR